RSGERESVLGSPRGEAPRMRLSCPGDSQDNSGMRPSNLALLVSFSMSVVSPHPASASAQDGSRIAGQWALNRELSQLPREIGFRVEWLTKGGSGDETGGGGRGGRGSGSAGGLITRRESEEDAKRPEHLTDEAANPSAALAMVETPTAVTITDDGGHARTLHPDSKQEVLQLDGVPVGVTTRREAGRLVILYQVEQGRELRYTYSRMENPAQLVVDVQFVQRGGGDKLRRVYEPATAADSLEPAAPEPARAPVKPDVGSPAAGASAPP